MSKSSDQEELSAAIASIAGALAAELQQSSSPPFVDPNADLNAAYGIDSLARVELISRIEKQFGARLPEADAIRAATAAEMAHLLQRSLDPAGTSKFRGASKQIHTPLDAAQEPAGASTLLDVLDWHVQHAPERNHVIFEEEENSAVALTYGELRQSASRFAAGLHHAGVEPQTAVALMLPTGLDFLISFFGCLLAGTVPVPLYPPFQHTQLEEHLRRNLATLSNCRASAMIVFPEIHTAARLARFALPGLSLISTPEEILSGPTTAIQRKAAAEQPAFIQYTSGSTSSPKGVVLSHGNLLANIRAMGQACGVRQGDVFASWLPLYHDMGLIGAWFGSLYYGIPLVLMSPLSFIAHPERWLRAIDRFRATISGGPNFAYQLCASRLDSEKLAGLNLSSWRIAFNGAEPVSANTITAFCRRFAPYEFKPEAVLPVYGLAENCVGLCFPPPGRGARIETVSRTKLQLHGIAERIPPEDPDAYASVSCGRPLLGHQLRIIDTEGNEMPE
ncbi:MAG TPA: AMP-binding protein, partial [Oligoflexia bacterium]|nr:AMP-binding protein [Oligoflexia bacterium]